MRQFRIALNLILNIFCLQNLIANDVSWTDLIGSREGDPESLVQNVSTIFGDYSEVEVDLVVSGPDPIVLSRYYSSKDHPYLTNLGRWRFIPHCFLSIQQTLSEPLAFDHVFVGTTEGSIVTYSREKNANHSNILSLFKINSEQIYGLSNCAKGDISSWSNLKNNELYFHTKSNHFELRLCSGEKRIYIKHPSLDFYLLSYEVLPSGNKIFYEYDNLGQLILIKSTNASEEKILNWVKIYYGNEVHIETSDGTTIDYHFQDGLLTKVIRSNKPTLTYEYQIISEKALLRKKALPEERFVEISYYDDPENKVQVITVPLRTNEVSCTQFSYISYSDGSGATEIEGPSSRKRIYRFNPRFQLESIEHYHKGLLYHVQKKVWGEGKNATNLIASFIEDGNANVFYYKSLSYDERGNILEDRKYGNLTGAHPDPLVLDEKGIPESHQECHIKTYSYEAGNTFDIINQIDAKGNGIKFFYKKGTRLLAQKFIFEKKDIKRRYFYSYDENGTLISSIVDDGYNSKFYFNDEFFERHIIKITPKENFPNLGAPEVIEEKYFDWKNQKETSLKKVVNHFDEYGQVICQDIYDAKEVYRYSLKKHYDNGLLTFETDPLGNESHYTYDSNHNLILEKHSAENVSFEYGYDLQNHLIYSAQKNGKGKVFETHMLFDAEGNKQSEIDRFGYETRYDYDDLGRLISVSYPKVLDDQHSFIHPTYTYQYDLFDHPISVTDPLGNVTSTSYNVQGNPTNIVYPDGTSEFFKYDPEGSLHRHCAKDGTVKIFEYDYLGRITHIECYARKSKDQDETHGKWINSYFYEYDAFHLTSKKDQHGKETTYKYDSSGHLRTLTKGEKIITFLYDPLGRNHVVKKWKDSKTYTAHVKAYDLLGRVIEERIKDQNNTVLLKSNYIYDAAGRLAQVIGYPQNQISPLFSYEYDDFGRLSKITDVCQQSTKFFYDDDYINEWGQKVLKRVQIDPLENETEEMFDPLSNLVKRTKKDQTGILLTTQEFSYDLLNQRTLAKNSIILSGEILGSYVTEQEYNSVGQLLSITYGKRNKDERKLSFQYNSLGQLIAQYASDDKEPLSYHYNNEGWLASISFKEENQKEKTTYRLNYDLRGNVIQAKLSSTQIIARNWGKDEDNQLISEKITDEFGSYKVSLTYTNEGKIQTIRLPDDSIIEYLYEGPLVKSVIRKTNKKKKLYEHVVKAYDQMGRVLEETLLGTTGSRKHVWDLSAKKTAIITDHFKDCVPQDGFDPFQNILEKETSIVDEEYRSLFAYDELSRLVSEEGKISHCYSYDSLGNRLQKDATLYKINPLNQLTETDSHSFAYDLNGNVSSKTCKNNSWQFHFNPLSQLTQVRDSKQNELLFTYDLTGRRLSKQIVSKNKKIKIERYFYLDQVELGSLDENDNIISLKIPLNPNHPESTECIAIEIKSNPCVPLYDLQNNIVCLIDPQQNQIVERYRYSAFGEEEVINEKGVIISNSVVGNPWRYQGKRKDEETGLLYFGKRYYDPESGRWMSPDPAGEIDGPNLYVFVQNNPINYTDYFGLATEINESQSKEFMNYFYGEYETHCFCETHRTCKRGGDLKHTFSLSGPDFFNLTMGPFFSIRSEPYEVGSWEPKRGGIGFINGIDNFSKDSRKSAKKISSYGRGVKIHSIYNATHTPPVDIVECLLGLCGIPSRPVFLLKKQWQEFIDSHGPDDKYLQISHSGGCIFVEAGLFYSPESVRKRIISLAIAPGAIIPQELCAASFNYASRRDFVPYLDVEGYKKYRNQLIILEPHQDAPLHDHGLDSPTFKSVIQYHIEKYLEKFGD